MNYCDCQDWKPGIEEINGFISFAWCHDIGYKGKCFVFCPWCGKKLEKKEEDK